jgi:hypothetical protein
MRLALMGWSAFLYWKREAKARSFTGLTFYPNPSMSFNSQPAEV